MSAKVFVKNGKKYKLVPPEGGWGYIIGLSVSITYVISVVPLLVFGIIFTDFLATLGDPTGATTLLNGVMYTVFCFTGLPANHLLQTYSYRTVGLLGAVLYSIGACGNIFVTSFMEMMISFGIFQGMGYGLMLPAVFCAFNVYFDERQNIVMAVCQALIVGASVVAPAITKYLMTTFGFRGTLVLFAAFSLNGFVAMGALQPVEWHLKTEEIDGEDVKPAFTINSSFIWIVSVSACLGFFRCFIETPMPLVIAEEYGPRFATAFSLYMVVCGVISLIVGVLSAGLKQLTGSNTAVVHLLTVVYLLCAIPWILEVIIVRFTKKKLTQ